MPISEFEYRWVCRTFKFQRVPTCFCHAEEVILWAVVGGRRTRELVESSRAKLEPISLIPFAIQADSGFYCKGILSNTANIFKELFDWLSFFCAISSQCY